MDKVLKLQDETRAALPEEQKMFVLPQKPEYFEKLLSGETGGILGVLTGAGELVAQIALMGPVSLKTAIEKKLLTRNEIRFHHAQPMETVVLAKSMSVHPGWRGNELSQQLLAAVIEAPVAHAADHLCAQISVDNRRSWELFLKNGFGVIAAAIDPGDEKARFILQQPTGGFAYDAPVAEDVSPTDDLSAIVQLTQREGLVGRLDEEAGNTQLAFCSLREESKDTVSIWAQKS